MLMQQLPAFGRFVVEVPVRHAGAAQVIAEPVGAGRVGRPDDAKGDLGRFTGLVPGREESGHRWVQVSFRWEPRDVQVIVDLPHRHRRDGGMRAGPVAPVDEQDSLGPRMQPVRAGQEVYRGSVRQVLVRDDQCDLGTRARQNSQHGQGRGGRARDADLVIGLVAPAQVMAQRAQARLVAGNQQEDWPLHDRLPQGPAHHNPPECRGRAAAVEIRWRSGALKPVRGPCASPNGPVAVKGEQARRLPGRREPPALA